MMGDKHESDLSTLIFRSTLNNWNSNRLVASVLWPQTRLNQVFIYRSHRDCHNQTQTRYPTYLPSTPCLLPSSHLTQPPKAVGAEVNLLSTLHLSLSHLPSTLCLPSASPSYVSSERADIRTAIESVPETYHYDRSGGEWDSSKATFVCDVADSARSVGTYGILGALSRAGGSVTPMTKGRKNKQLMLVQSGSNGRVDSLI